jgi:hypothetical protein
MNAHGSLLAPRLLHFHVVDKHLSGVLQPDCTVAEPGFPTSFKISYFKSGRRLWLESELSHALIFHV